MTETDENVDTQETIPPADQRDQIQDQLERVPDNPSMGDLAVAADALADARELAEDEPAVAAELVPDIVRVLQQAEGVSLGKGADVLPGEFTGRSSREGMRVLAALNPHQLCPDEAADARIGSILETVQVVLATDRNITAKSHAICTVGTLSIVVPQRVSDELRAGEVSEQVEWLLSAVDEADRLGRLVRATALLAGHPATQSLVAGVEQSAIVQAAEEMNLKGLVWLHVLYGELDRDSPVNPAPAWIELEERQDPVGLCWWLLAGYSADAIPAVSSEPIESVLRQSNAELAVRDVCQLSDRFDFGELINPSLSTTLQAVIKKDDSNWTIRRSAADGLARLAGEKSVSGKSRKVAINALETAIEDDKSAVRRAAAWALADIVDGHSVSSRNYQATTEILETALKHDDSDIRRNAALALTRWASEEVVSSKSWQAAINALETALENDDSAVQFRAARELARQEGEESVSSEGWQAAINVLETAIENDDWFNRLKAARALGDLAGERSLSKENRLAAIRGLETTFEEDELTILVRAMHALTRLARETSASSECHQAAIQSLEAALENDDWSVQLRAARALGNLAGEQSVSSENWQKAIQVLETGLEDDDSAVRVNAAEALGNLAGEQSVSSESRQATIQALETGLEDDDPAVWRDAAEAIGDLAGREWVSSESWQAIIQALEAGLEDDEPAVRRDAAEGLTDLPRELLLTDNQTTDVTGALLNALSNTDEVVRKTAVDGLQTVSQTHPSVFTANQDFLIELSAQLRPTQSTTTSHLLVAIETLAAHDPAILSPIVPDLKRLLTDDAPIEIQVQTLELLSRLGEPTAEPQGGDDD
jgi:HEAT repeat protein